MWARVAIAVGLVACGRIGFEPLDDGGAPADVPGPIGNRVFVTSSTQAPVSFGGVAGADQICMDRAREARLPGRFVAFISISSVPARDRLLGARGWYRVDGEPIADTIDDLVGDRMILPITLDERGGDHSEDETYVTTGSYAGITNATCSDYTDGVDGASAGHTFYAGGGWMNTDIVLCSEPTRLYCFQVDYDLPLMYSRAIGRTAFLSAALFSPSSGIGAADAICRNEAQTAGLLGNYQALLPDQAPPAQRFTAQGAPWVRTDGIALAATAGDFMLGRSSAPLCVLADGTFSFGYVTTGSVTPSFPYDSNRDCGGWTDPAAGNEYGHISAIGRAAFGQTTSECMTAQPVYCLEI